MPNWCSNYLVVEGPDSDEFIRKVKEIVEQEKTVLETLVPSSPEFYKTIVHADGTSTSVFADGGMGSVYELWGTKWPDSDGYLSDKSYSFQSPWGPPLQGIARISELYPQAIFSIAYEEGGMGFAGVNAFENGEMVYEAETDFDSLVKHPGSDSTEEQDDEWMESIGQAVNDWLDNHQVESVEKYL